MGLNFIKSLDFENGFKANLRKSDKGKSTSKAK